MVVVVHILAMGVIMWNVYKWERDHAIETDMDRFLRMVIILFAIAICFLATMLTLEP